MLLTKPCKILIFPKRKTSQKPANTALSVSARNCMHPVSSFNDLQCPQGGSRIT